SPTSQTISVTPSANTNFTVIPTTTTGGNWLFLGASGGVTPATVSVSVLSSTLAVGSYNGTITFTATNGTTQTVPVILNVTTTGGGGGGNVTVTPMSLTFSGQAGAGSLPVQSLDLESALGSSPVSFTVSATTTSG